MRTQQYRGLRRFSSTMDAMWAEEQRGHSDQQTIDDGEIRPAMSSTLADQQLMFEEERLRGDGTHATGTQKFHKCDK